MHSAHEILNVDADRVLTISIVVLYLGLYLNKKIKFLERNCTPPSATGGLLCSITVAITYKTSGPKINFDLQIRNLLLLFFLARSELSAPNTTSS